MQILHVCEPGGYLVFLAGAQILLRDTVRVIIDYAAVRVFRATTRPDLVDGFMDSPAKTHHQAERQPVVQIWYPLEGNQ